MSVLEMKGFFDSLGIVNRVIRVGYPYLWSVVVKE